MSRLRPAADHTKDAIPLGLPTRIPQPKKKSVYGRGWISGDEESLRAVTPIELPCTSHFVILSRRSGSLGCIVYAPKGDEGTDEDLHSSLFLPQYVPVDGKTELSHAVQSLNESLDVLMSSPFFLDEESFPEERMYFKGYYAERYDGRFSIKRPKEIDGRPYCSIEAPLSMPTFRRLRGQDRKVVGWLVAHLIKNPDYVESVTPLAQYLRIVTPVKGRKSVSKKKKPVTRTTL